MRQLREDVRCRRCDQQKIRFIRKTDMDGLPSFLLVIKVCDDRMPRQRFEWQRGNESLRISRQDCMYITTFLSQPAREVHRLVGRDGPGHSKDNLARGRHGW